MKKGVFNYKDAETIVLALAIAARWHDTVLPIVKKQAEDDGLWFDAHTAPEAYLQQELRKLHAIIEGET